MKPYDNSKISHPRCVYINNRCGYQSITQQYLKKDVHPLLNIFFRYCCVVDWYPHLLFLNKHCDNAATTSNSENARSRTVASLRGRVCTGTKEAESSTGWVCAVGFHHVTARSAWRACWNFWTVYFCNFFNFFFRTAANRGYGGPPVQNSNGYSRTIKWRPWKGLNCFAIGTSGGLSEHGSKSSIYRKCGEFVDYLKNC